LSLTAYCLLCMTKTFCCNRIRCKTHALAFLIFHKIIRTFTIMHIYFLLKHDFNKMKYLDYSLVDINIFLLFRLKVYLCHKLCNEYYCKLSNHKDIFNKRVMLEINSSCRNNDMNGVINLELKIFIYCTIDIRRHHKYLGMRWSQEGINWHKTTWK
jgi:hypothetical protein